jgi:imidazolonepropionase-like amidohydrolase
VDGDLTLVNAVVFDGVSAELVEGGVRIAGGRIVAVGDVAPDSGPDSGPVLDVRGGTVVPGLIDAHFHAYGISLDPREIDAAPLSYVAAVAARRLGAALRRGFTTVRDVAGGDPGLSRAIREGLFPSPRYLYTGPALSQTGGHGDGRPAESALCSCAGHMCEVVDGVDALRRATRDRFRRGAHAIKIMASGGVISPTDPLPVPQYSAEEIRAVTAEAARRGSYVAAHAYSPEAIRHAADNGVRSIEHGNLLDAETAALLAQRHAVLVPTLITYDAMDRRGPELALSTAAQAKNREVLTAGQHAIELARAAGVPVGFGTDLMGALEDEQLAGLRLQAEVDGALGVLRSATSANADLLGRPDLGRVAAGAVADLLVLPGNPLTDPTLLWASQRRTVIQGGTIRHQPPP